MRHLLAVDLGGTKSRLGLFSLDKKSYSPIIQAVYKNSDYSGIEEIIDSFFSDHGTTAEYGCFAVAGVVEENRAELTNLAWTLESSQLCNAFGFDHTLLVNDLMALSMSIPLLGDNDTVTVYEAEKKEKETIGVIAPGTGLGQGYLVPYSEGYLVRGSEGGHCGFCPANEHEIEILRWLLKKHKVVSAEHVCAGPGIGELYRFYLENEKNKPTREVRDRIEQSDDITPAVVAAAVAPNPCVFCRNVINTYLEILGRETANLALKLYARGGIFIGGGVVLHLLGKVSFDPFIQGYLSISKMSHFLSTIPVFCIKREDSNLLGAFDYAVNTLLQK